MRKIRVYVDTSVFGGTQDEEFSAESQNFFNQVQAGNFSVILSEQTLRELSRSPDSVQAVWQNLPAHSVENIPVDDEISELAYAYIVAKVLGAASIGDALHVAAATVAGADLILSWNFKHIVNFNRIRGFNSVNIRMGYRAMTILSPKEVGDEDEENQDI
ncbi:MAG: PIN domain-containing protein [Desulfobacterales bacterium]|nr:PIN domain-containing protein [Desulfobacterales bacterium]